MKRLYINRSQAERIRLGLDWAYSRLLDGGMLQSDEHKNTAVLHLRAPSVLLSDLLDSDRDYAAEREEQREGGGTEALCMALEARALRLRSENADDPEAGELLKQAEKLRGAEK